MEYSLANDETIDQGIRRIHARCVKGTISIIRPPHQDLNESIHNTRKSFKFLRALIRLVRSPLGIEIYNQENRFFRDLGRDISDLRDIHVMSIILQYVATEAHSVRPKDINSGQEGLKRREEQLLAEAESNDLFGKVASGLEDSLSRFHELPEIPNELNALLPGLKAVYGSGREHYLQVCEDPNKERLHEWRKQVKYLLHQFQVLQGYWPSALGINGTSLQQLSDYLGEEHDLALFDDLLREDSFRDKLHNIEAMQAYVDQKRSHLQRSALNLGEFIYAREPDEFIAYFE